MAGGVPPQVLQTLQRLAIRCVAIVNRKIFETLWQTIMWLPTASLGAEIKIEMRIPG